MSKRRSVRRERIESAMKAIKNTQGRDSAVVFLPGGVVAVKPVEVDSADKNAKLNFDKWTDAVP